ncbi:MAG: class I tRNA ligase family protein, partial [Patescibacteria group bacterium]
IGPMDGSPDFRDTGIAGMKRFTDRVWRLFTEYPDVILIAEEDAREILQKMHQTIKKVTTDIQNFRYNVAIASLMEFVNLLEEKAQGKIKRGGKIRCAEWDEALKSLALMLAPLAPHLAEEVWVEVLGQKFSIHTHPWPKFNPLIAKEEEIELVIQINGKLRGTLSVGKDESLVRGEMEKLARKEPNIAKWLKGREVKKVVFVPGKLINFVTE